VSEAWFGVRLRRRPAYRWAGEGPAEPPSLPVGQPEPLRRARPGLAKPAGIALIITGTVLLLAVSTSLAFLNVKLLGLILIVIGLVMVRALQRAAGWLWRNRHDVMTALDAPADDPAERVPLDTILAAPPAADASGKARRSLAGRAKARRSRIRRSLARRGPAPSKPGPGGQAAR
jgi:hypothetical protein